MINYELLIEFTKTKFLEKLRAPKNLELALINSDITNFLNKNNIVGDSIVDNLKIACILGLIKHCLVLDIHELGEKTMASAFGIANARYNIGKGRFENWVKSDSLFSFYENTLPILKMIQMNKLKINALTIVDDVMMLQSHIDGDDFDKKPFDRFAVRESMYSVWSIDEKIITPKMVLSARTTANLTQKEAAALVYVDERSWQRWESGDRKMNRNVYELFLIKTGIFA